MLMIGFWLGLSVGLYVGVASFFVSLLAPKQATIRDIVLLFLAPHKFVMLYDKTIYSIGEKIDEDEDPAGTDASTAPSPVAGGSTLPSISKSSLASESAETIASTPSSESTTITTNATAVTTGSVPLPVSIPTPTMDDSKSLKPAPSLSEETVLSTKDIQDGSNTAATTEMVENTAANDVEGAVDAPDSVDESGSSILKDGDSSLPLAPLVNMTVKEVMDDSSASEAVDIDNELASINPESLPSPPTRLITPPSPSPTPPLIGTREEEVAYASSPHTFTAADVGKLAAPGKDPETHKSVKSTIYSKLHGLQEKIKDKIHHTSETAAEDRGASTPETRRQSVSNIDGSGDMPLSPTSSESLVPLLECEAKNEKFLGRHKCSSTVMKDTEAFLTKLAKAQKEYAGEIQKLCTVAQEIEDEYSKETWSNVAIHLQKTAKIVSESAEIFERMVASVVTPAVKDHNSIGDVLETQSHQLQKELTKHRGPLSKAIAARMKWQQKVLSLQDADNLSKSQLFSALQKTQSAAHEEQSCSQVLAACRAINTIKFENVNKDFETLERNRQQFTSTILRQYITVLHTQTEESNNAVKQFETQAAPAAGKDSSPGPQFLPVSNPFAIEITESADRSRHLVINKAVNRIFIDFNSENMFSERIHKILTKTFQRASNKLPGFVDNIRVDSVKISDVAPVLKSFRPINIKSPGHIPNYIPDELTFEAQVNYNGNVAIEIGTEIFFNWPIKHAASVPVHVSFQVVELQGKCILGIRNGYYWFSFTKDPFVRFSIKSSFGSTAFQNMPALANFIIDRIKKAIRERVVFPNCHCMNLPWPPHKRNGRGSFACSWPLFPEIIPIVAPEVASNKIKLSEIRNEGMRGLIALSDDSLSDGKGGTEELKPSGPLLLQPRPQEKQSGSSSPHSSNSNSIEPDGSGGGGEPFSVEDNTAKLASKSEDGIDLLAEETGKEKADAGGRVGMGATSTTGAVPPSVTVSSLEPTKDKPRTTFSDDTNKNSLFVSKGVGAMEPIFSDITITEARTKKPVDLFVVAGSKVDLKWALRLMYIGNIKSVTLELCQCDSLVIKLATLPPTSDRYFLVIPITVPSGPAYTFQLAVVTSDKIITLKSKEFSIALPKETLPSLAQDPVSGGGGASGGNSASESPTGGRRKESLVSSPAIDSSSLRKKEVPVPDKRKEAMTTFDGSSVAKRKEAQAAADGSSVKDTSSPAPPSSASGPSTPANTASAVKGAILSNIKSLDIGKRVTSFWGTGGGK